MIDIRKTTRISIPAIPFERIASDVLGKQYELSLVLCGDALAREMNREYRKKTYAANVLSFPYLKNEGEIFLNVRTAAREAKRYGISLRDRIALLFVHGCYHLKGLDHGMRMEQLEHETLRRYRFDG